MNNRNSFFLCQLYINAIQANTVHTNDLQVGGSLNQFLFYRSHTGDDTICIANQFLYILNKI